VGLTPVGYGYRSVGHIVSSMIGIEARPELLDEIEREGIVATAGNSSYNERVIEAGRRSILNGGERVTLEGGL
jgi:hypothetical protein